LEESNFYIDVESDFNLGCFNLLKRINPEEFNLRFSITANLEGNGGNFIGSSCLDDESLIDDPVIPPEMKIIKFNIELNIKFISSLDDSLFHKKDVDVDFIISINGELSDGNVNMVVHLDFVFIDLPNSP